MVELTPTAGVIWDYFSFLDYFLTASVVRRAAHWRKLWRGGESPGGNYPLFSCGVRGWSAGAAGFFLCSHLDYFFRWIIGLELREDSNNSGKRHGTMDYFFSLLD